MPEWLRGSFRRINAARLVVIGRDFEILSRFLHVGPEMPLTGAGKIPSIARL